MSPSRIAAAAAVLCCACGDADSDVWVRSEPRQAGELALPPSANAPRVMRDELAPDTLAPDTVGEFAILGSDSLSPGIDLPAGLIPDLGVDAIADAYRDHYADALRAEGSAVAGRIDRELQHEAELRTARDRGFADWTELIGALSPEARAALVDRLNEANVDLARELHGPPAVEDPPQPPG